MRDVIVSSTLSGSFLWRELRSKDLWKPGRQLLKSLSQWLSSCVCVKRILSFEKCLSDFSRNLKRFEELSSKYRIQSEMQPHKESSSRKKNWTNWKKIKRIHYLIWLERLDWSSLIFEIEEMIWLKRWDRVSSQKVPKRNY